MDYIQLNIQVQPTTQQANEILIAQLAEIGFESFTEEDNGLNAYIRVIDYSDEVIEKIKGLIIPEGAQITYTIDRIKDQNWNTLWESNFEPIIVNDRCMVRASFHKDTPKLDYDIVIDPKMAFGTGHHQTTHLMIQAILDNDFTDKIVLDMGCGTGVLAILAEMKGAKSITAIDIDEWAYNNTIENIQINGCKSIEPLCGDVQQIAGKKFDIVLANINRNILLSDIKHYTESMLKGGLLILSGILKSDIDAITHCAGDSGLTHISTSTRDEWVTMSFIKPH